MGGAQLHHRLACAIDRSRPPGSPARSRPRWPPWPRALRASADSPPLLRSTPVTSMSRPVAVRVTCRVGADFGCSRKRFGQPRQGRESRDQARIGDRARLDRHQVPGATLLEAQQRALPLGALSGVQCHAAARGPAARRERRQDLALQTFHRQLDADLLGLPAEIGLRRPVLQGQPPQWPKYLQGGVTRSGAGGQDLHDLAARTFHPRPHGFARQGQGHEGWLAVVKNERVRRLARRWR